MSSRPSRRPFLVAVAAAAILLVPGGVLAAPRLADAQPGRHGPDLGADARRSRPQPTWKATIAAGRQAMADVLAATGATSGSVTFVDGATIPWTETFGRVDSDGTPPAPTQRYGIGSVSKTLAAVAILRLVDAGLVDLDAPLRRYLPELRLADPAADQITVRMLLAHTAGLPGTDYANSATTEPFPGYLDQLLAGLAGARLKTTPGAMAVYCNDCYSLLEGVVASVTGRPYTAYVQDEILGPLGMTGSGFATAPFPDGTLAPVIDRFGNRQAPELIDLYASGGLYATGADMGRLAAMLLSGGELDGTRILSEAAVAAMGTDQTVGLFDPLGSDDWRYGLGFDSVREPALAAAGWDAWVKGGDSSQYHASMILVPKAKLGVVVQLAGLTTGSAAAQAVAERILLEALVERGSLRKLPRAVKAPTPARRAPTAEQLAAITGTWVGAGVIERITATDDGRIQASTWTNGAWVDAPYTASLRKDGGWWADADAIQGLSVVSGWGRDYLALHRPTGAGNAISAEIIGQRVTPGDPLPAAWEARIGRTWVPVGEVASSLAWQQPGLTPAAIPGLPGFVAIPAPGNLQVVDPAGADDRASSFLVIPGLLGRDLFDVRVVQRGAQEWLQVGPDLYRPVDGVPHLRAGAATKVTIDPDTVAAWLGARDAVTVTTTGATAWKVLDEALAVVVSGPGDAPDVGVPSGGYLVVFGDGGATIDIAAR
ncbi:MAG: serine hydrolase domain-containing protein [Chloroflexota bacterium]